MTKPFYESGSRVRRPSRKDSTLLKTRDFFKLAADMANPSVKMALNNKIDLPTKSLVQDKILTSPLLDPTYQKCTLIFNAENNDIIAHNVITIGPMETLNAPILHNYIVSYFNEKPAQPFYFRTAKAQFVIERGCLFWANRLKHKSQQSSTGVQSGLKYYHAQLCASRPNPVEINVLYWLKFDEHDQTVGGALVNIENRNLT
ncbi:MAG: hypothetical protein BWZ03_00560 [bacterium ADurb.BinA186]|nr:MAG: hypothetical protein BWZ03_00560 [bacterium ADurb.BinA186]